MTDRTAAALAAALPAEIAAVRMGHPELWDRADIAAFQAERLADLGWRLIHADEHSHPCTCQYRPPQTFAEHYAQALALIHDHVEASDE
jgi:hypothetical protein